MDAVGNVIGLGTSRYTRTYTSFSGTDIKVVFHNQVMAEIQGISYSVTREKAPSYVMGSADPVSFSRGKLLPRNQAQTGNASRKHANPVGTVLTVSLQTR